MAGKRVSNSQVSYNYKKEEGDGSAVLLIGVLVLLIIVFGAAAIYVLQPPEVPEGPGPDVPPDQPPDDVPDAECDDQCKLDRALTGQNVSMCLEIEDGSIAQECFEGLAGESFDACRRVANRTLFSDCVHHHAMSAGDPSICDYLDSGVGECKIEVDSCYALSGSQMRSCLADKHMDIAYCEDDQECIYNYTMDAGDSEYCSLLSDEVLKYACSSILNDQDDCYFAGTTSKKNLCRLMWAKASGDRLTCTMITPETVYALQCYTHFAIETSDVAFCNYNKVLELDDLWQCYINYSLATGDSAGCDAIDKRAPTSRFTCYFDTAKAFGNPQICDLIGDPGQTTTCYVGTIMGNSNLDYNHCEVNQVIWTNKCYTEYAKLTGESYYCEFIDTVNEQNVCYDAFEVSGE